MNPICLKETEQSTPRTGVTVKVADERDDTSKRNYCCIGCQTPIAEATMIPINGKQRHTFANPGGEVFYIGCFANAWHLIAVGDPTDQFTWFPGYSWQVAVCGRCGLHLGWQYLGEKRFFGLIMDRLILVESDER